MELTEAQRTALLALITEGVQATGRTLGFLRSSGLVDEQDRVTAAGRRKVLWFASDVAERLRIKPSSFLTMYRDSRHSDSVPPPDYYVIDRHYKRPAWYPETIEAWIPNRRRPHSTRLTRPLDHPFAVEYLAGDSIALIAERHSISTYRVRRELLAEGVTIHRGRRRTTPSILKGKDA